MVKTQIEKSDYFKITSCEMIDNVTESNHMQF